jgi:hypothetical protein
MEMPKHLLPHKKVSAISHKKLCHPLTKILGTVPKLQSRCNRPLQMEFEDQLNALIFFHLEEHTSGSHLIHSLKENDFAREFIAPEKGIAKSSFFEAMSERGLEQFFYVFQELQKDACTLLPQKHPELGQLVAIDGSLIDAVLSLEWADYRKGAKKAKTHIGFDLNRGIPRKIFFTDGKGSERPFVSKILAKGETGVLDRGYQCHRNFDLLQKEGQTLRLPNQGKYHQDLSGDLPSLHYPHYLFRFQSPFRTARYQSDRRAFAIGRLPGRQGLLGCHRPF